MKINRVFLSLPDLPVSGLETTERRVGFCNIAGADGYPSWRLERGVT